MNLAGWRIKAGSLKIGPREKLGIIMLAVVGVVGVGYQRLIATQMRAAGRARTAYLQSEHDIVKLEAKRPPVKERRAQADRLQAQVTSVYQQLEDMEQGLLNRQDLNELLQQVVANRDRLELQMNSVRPVKDETGGGADRAAASTNAAIYTPLLIQIDTYAAFHRLIAYIEALEHQGPYQRVLGVNVKMEGQDMVRPRALILVQTLLAETSEKVAQRREEILETAAQLARRDAKDPFVPLEKPKEEQVAIGLELTGVFGTPGSMTALINGESYQVGDLIQGKRIVAIAPDRVVLEQGARRFLLSGRQASP